MNVFLIHGLFLSVAWLGLVPVSLFIARYFKVTPKQDYPRELDNTFWWKTHLFCNTVALIFSVIGVALLLAVIGPVFTAHALTGYVALMFSALTALSGLLRGSTGGPDQTPPPGKQWDHYHLTKRRIIFEWFHKICGRLTFFMAILAIALRSEFMQAFWLYFLPQSILFLALWIASVVLEPRRRVTTYQAIWGPNKRHPGNRVEHQLPFFRKKIFRRKND